MLRYLIVPALLFSTIAAAQESENYAFVGVHVVSMEANDVLTDQTVLPRSAPPGTSRSPATP